jgi:hypothetical protein
MKRKFTFLLLSFFCFVQVNAQINPVKNAYAFYKTYLPGMLRVDANGTPVKPDISIERFIYIEYKAKATFDVAEITYSNKKYKVIETSLAGTKVKVGVKSNTGAPIEMTASKGYTFWLIRLEQQSEASDETLKKLKTINIRIKSGTKYFNFLLNNETHLVAPEMQ